MPTGAQLIVNEQWGQAIPPIPAAFTEVVDVAAGAYQALLAIPGLLQRWSAMRSAYDNFLQLRIGHALDNYYRIVKESQLAAVLIMNPAATQTQLFDMCIGVQPGGTPDTVNELKSLNQDSAQFRSAEAQGTAAGFVPPGL